MNLAPPTYRPAGSLPSDPLAPYPGRLTARLAAHLLRRAGFGGTPAETARVASLTPDAAVAELMRFPSEPLAPPSLVSAADDDISPAASLLDIKKARQRERRAQLATNVRWWMDRMLTTPAPLQEKLTLFLHGHFATAANTKGIYGLEIVEQNALLRSYALGNWQTLTHYVARDVAMLRYLDNARSTKAHPNENFARELMELFTLGIGTYTERDVRESARAFTGYTFSRRTVTFFFDAANHDDGSKTFLGRTGNLNGDDAIDAIFAQPACAAFFATKLLEFFVYSDPEPELVRATSSLIREHRYEMAPVMAVLLRSNVFYSERAYRALVKSPIEFVVGSLRLFGGTTVDPKLLPVMLRMGQLPFKPPSVKGWDGGAQWLNTQTVLARENFASGLTSAPMPGDAWLTGAPPADARSAARTIVATIVQEDASPAALARLEAYLDGSGTSADGKLSPENYQERMRGAAYLTMAMPAYQLA